MANDDVMSERERDATTRRSQEDARMSLRAAYFGSDKPVCHGVQYATGRSQCWEIPTWVVMPAPGAVWDGSPERPDMLACRKHVAALLDGEHGSLVMPVTS